MRRVACLIVVGFALAGCRVTGTVSIAMKDDGSGTVSAKIALDSEAVQAAEVGGGRLEDRVRLSDLAAAGWKVTPWARSASGAATLTLSHGFAQPQDVATLVAQLSGKQGPLQGFTATHDSSWIRTSSEMRGTVDMRKISAGVTDDAELVQRLTANQVDVSALSQRVDTQLHDSLRLEVELDIAGTDAKAVIAAPGQRRTVAVSKSETHFDHVLLLLLGLILGVVAIVVFVVGERRDARHRRFRRSRSRVFPDS